MCEILSNQNRVLNGKQNEIENEFVHNFMAWQNLISLINSHTPNTLVFDLIFGLILIASYGEKNMIWSSQT